MKKATFLTAAVGLVLGLGIPAQASVTDGLVGYWAFNDPGSPGDDSSGNNYAGTAQGDASFSANGFLGDGALALDGDGDYMQLPDMSAEFVKSASLSFWVKLTNHTPTDSTRTGFMDFDTGSASNYPTTSGTINCALFRLGGRFQDVAPVPEIQRDEWHLITVVSDRRAGYSIYQNDQQIFIYNQPSFKIADFRLGTQNDTWLDGMIDEVGLWNRALTPAEVSALYNGGAGLDILHDGTLTSTADGNWNASGTWSGDVPGGVPTGKSLAVVDGETVDVNAPALASELALSAGVVNVNASLTLSNKAVLSGGALNIASGQTFTASSSNTAGMTFADATATLDVANLTVDSAVDLSAANVPLDGRTIAIAPTGTLTVPSPATVANITVNTGGTLAAAAAIATTGNITVFGSLGAGGNVTAGAELTLDGATVNVSGVASFSSGTDSLTIENAPDLNIASAGHMTIHAAGGGPIGDPLAYYSFDDEANLGLDGGAHGHDATNNGATWQAGSGDRLGVVRMDGTSLEADNMPAVTTAFTFAAWVNADQTQPGNEPTIMAYQQGTWGLLFEQAGNPQDIHLYNQDSWQWNSHTDIFFDKGNWQHLAVTWDTTSGTVTFYENGDQTIVESLTGQTSPVTSVGDGSKLTIGARHGGSMTGGLDQPFRGLMDDAYVFDRALSAEEIFQLYESGGAAAFGALTMAAGAQLTLDGDDGLGTGEASFTSISGEGTIRGVVTAGGTLAPGGSAGGLVIEGDFIAESASNITWQIGALIDVNAGEFAGDVRLKDGWTVTIDEAADPTLGVAYPVIECEGALTFGNTVAGPLGLVTNNVLNDVGAGDWSTASLWHDSNSVFIVASANRTWDGSVGNWSGSNWLPGSPSGPTVLGIMTVDNGEVTVDAAHTGMNGAMSLTMGGGAVHVANQLEVVRNVAVNAGVLAVGSTLTVGNTIDVAAAGALQVNPTGTVTSPMVTSLGTVNVAGHLNSPLINSSGAFNVTGFGRVTADAVNLTGGTASFADTAVLGMAELNIDSTVVTSTGIAAGVEALALNSGELSISGDVTAETIRLKGGLLRKTAAGTATVSATKIQPTGSDVRVEEGTLTFVGLPRQAMPAGILGYWPFDGDLTDQSGNGYDGEFYGNGGFSDDVAGAIGGGQSLDLTSGGHADVVVVDDGAGQTVFDLNALTVSVWAKGWTVRTWSQYVSKSENGWAVRTMPNYITLMLRGTSGPDDIAGTIQQPVDVNQWYHIVTTYDEATGIRKLWIDGELSIETDENPVTTINDRPGEYLVFGGRQHNDDIGYSSGMMLDEIYILDRAVSEEEAMLFYENAGQASFGDLTMLDNTQLELSGGGAGAFTSVDVGDDVTITGNVSTGSFVAGNDLQIIGNPTFAGTAVTGTGLAITGRASVEVDGRLAPTGGATITGNATVAGTIVPAGGRAGSVGGLGGTTTVSGNFEMLDGGNFEWTTFDGTQVETIAVGGRLTLPDSWSVTFRPAGAMALASGEHTLFTYGTLVGDLLLNEPALLVPSTSPYADLLLPEYSTVIDLPGENRVILQLEAEPTAVWADLAAGPDRDFNLDGNWTGEPGSAPNEDTAAVVNRSDNSRATVSGGADAFAHTLIIDDIDGTGPLAGGHVRVTGAGSSLTVANTWGDGPTHVMAGATLDVLAGAVFTSQGDTNVYDAGTLIVDGSTFTLDDDYDLNTGGTTTFSGASTLDLAEGIVRDKGNLNVTGGTTTIGAGVSVAVNGINATGGTLAVEADLSANAVALTVDGATVTSSALRAAAVNVISGSLASTGPANMAALDITGGHLTTAGATVSGSVRLGGAGQLSTNADVAGGTVELLGGTLTKTGAGSALVSATGGADIAVARGSDIRVEGGTLAINVAPAAPRSVDPVHVLLVTGGDPVETFVQDRLEARGFNVETRDQGLAPPDGAVPGEMNFDVANYQLVVTTYAVLTPNATKYGGTNVPMVTSSWDAYIPDQLGWTETRNGGTAGTTLDMVSPTHHPAGGRLSGIESVYADGDPRARAGGSGLSPDAEVIAEVDGMPVMFVYDVGDALLDIPGDPPTPRTALSRQIGMWWEYDLPHVTPQGLELFDAAVTYALGREDEMARWFGAVTLQDAAQLTIVGTGAAADIRSITLEGTGTGTVSAASGISVFRGLQPGIDVGGTIDVNADMTVEQVATYTWDTTADRVDAGAAGTTLTLEDGWTLRIEDDGPVTPVTGQDYVLFVYDTLAATVDVSEILTEVVIDDTVGLGDVFVMRDPAAKTVNLHIAPTLEWDGSAGAWGESKWIDGGVPGSPWKKFGHMSVPGGTVNVAGAYTSTRSALSLVVGGATAQANVTGDLTVARTVDVLADGSLTVAAGGGLTAPVLNTAGTVSLEVGSLGAIGTMNVSDGVVSVASTVTTLNVSDGVVTATGSTIADLTVGGGSVTDTGSMIGNATVNAGVVAADGTTLGGLTVEPGSAVIVGVSGVTITDGGTVKLDKTKMNIAGTTLRVEETPDIMAGRTLTYGDGTLALTTGGGMPDEVQLHLDASDINNDGGATNPADGATITDWMDVSGLDHHADNNWNAPTYNTNGPNGAPVVQFTNDVLSTTYNFDPLTAYTVFSVSHYTGGDNERMLSSMTRNWLLGSEGSANEKMYAEGWISNQGDTDTDWKLYVGTITNDADPVANFWVNGEQKATNSTGSGSGNHMIGRLALGGWRDNNQTANCEIGEVLIFDGVLSADQINDIGGYLAEKYGLAGTGYDGTLVGPAILPTTNIKLTGIATLDLGATGEAQFGELNLGDTNDLTIVTKDAVAIPLTVATLSGDGTIGGDVTGVIVTGSLAPGNNGLGTVSADVDLTLAEGAAFDAQILATGVDAIESLESVTIGADVSLNLLLVGGNEFTAGKHILIDALGGVIDPLGDPGRFTTVTDLKAYVSAGPNGDGVTYDDGDLGVVTLTLDMNLNPADANLDGATDVSDRIVWNNNNFTFNTTFVTGDWNNDGATDVSDRIIWNNNNFTFATGGPPGPIAADAAPGPLPAPKFIYDFTTGVMRVEANGHFLTEIVVNGNEGASLLSAIPFQNTRGGFIIWMAQNFNGKFQAYDAASNGDPGSYDLAEFAIGLDENDFIDGVDWGSVPELGQPGVSGNSPVTIVPEPATLALLGLGGMVVMVRRRRRK